MGLRESNGSLGRANAMIARLRKATTEWTAHLREGYSERLRKQAVLAGPRSSDKRESVREETTGQANTGEPARDVPSIPDFQLLRRIGHGSYGEVWLARNILGTYRAVKIVERKAFQDEEAFEREFSGLQQFEPVSREHEGFVAILHVARNRAEGFFYYVMELADSDSNGGGIEPETYVPKTLSNELARCERLSVEQAAQLGLSLSQALAELHQRGLVHRDVKPSNIIFVRGHAKLADIGLVAQTGEETRLGTEGYMPPEGPGRPQADLYSLGMLLYEAVSGADRLDYPALPADFDTMVKREAFLKLNSIILKACDNDLRKRYQTATEISDDLTKLGFSTEVQNGRSNFRRPVIVSSVVLFGALALALTFYSLRDPKTSPAPEKSVAILPFENLSRDPNDDYFAEGIQEEILTRLTKIADLKVISRTSTQRYQSKPANLSEIARQLGVANILEGSVQKVADQVRVNVQLVNAQTDSHIWAETYDRKLSDIFGVESEIAKGVAESLQAKLTGHEKQALAAKPTNNPEAYDAYLRGLAFQARIGQSIHLALKTIGYFERAVQLDPNFAIAWAHLSRARAYLYFQRVDTARPDLAKDALQHAQKLQPNSPETLLALGYYQYWVLRDYGLAKATFGLVSKLLPGNSDVAWALSAVNRRLGNWNESLAAVEAGLDLDPRNGELLTTSAWTYAMLRQFPMALKRYDQAADIIANDPDLMSLKGGIYQAQGNLEQAANLLSEISVQTPFENAFFVKVTQLRLERNYAEVIRVLQTRLVQFKFTSDIYKGATQVYLAIAQRLAGNTADAKFVAEQARYTLEPLCKNQPDNSNFAEWLALAYAELGEKELALKEAERAVMLLPSAKDAVDGPGTEENLALVQTIFGENSSAIATLRRLVQTPFQSQLYGPMPLAPAYLRLDPLWDSLRADPGFRELYERTQP
jgi:TolB-like protein/Flp pilus assembly protein TadD